MRQIPRDEVAFHAGSHGDPAGRLFWWNGGLYRAISHEGASLCRDLFDRGIVQNLIDKRLLVETELTSLKIDGFELVLKHRPIPFVSYPFEWCADMLKDAALLMIDLVMELEGYGLMLSEAYPKNVLFHGSRPVYVDFTNIVSGRQTRVWPEVFSRVVAQPLLLMSRGYDRIGRSLLKGRDRSILDSDLVTLIHRSLGGFESRGARIRYNAERLVPRSLLPVLTSVLDLIASRLPTNSGPDESYLGVLRRCREAVEKIPVSHHRTAWSNYDDDRGFPSFTSPEEWTAKHHSVSQTLAETRPKSVLDVGSNRGWYSQLAALNGSLVIAFDADEAPLAKLYRDAKAMRLPILPLVMDVRYPTPAFGSVELRSPPATERLKCDMVMALALVNHLVFGQRLNFTEVVDALSLFTKRWLLVEFSPWEDQWRRWWPTEVPWYTLKNFRSALRRHFREIKVLPSHPSPRVLLLCEK